MRTVNADYDEITHYTYDTDSHRPRRNDLYAHRAKSEIKC